MWLRVGPWNLTGFGQRLEVAKVFNHCLLWIASDHRLPRAIAGRDPLPHGLVTRDLAHLFYHNQMQINGGRNDSFVAWGDSGALVMGHYADTASSLRIAGLARRYTLCDNFFMGAVGPRPDIGD